MILETTKLAVYYLRSRRYQPTRVSVSIRSNTIAFVGVSARALPAAPESRAASPAPVRRARGLGVLSRAPSRAMASTLRRRRGAEGPNALADDSDGKAGGGRVRVPTTSATTRGSGKTFKRAFFVLLLARLASAALNLVHDCDETYNFWEPLHYLTHGHGMQTWEHAPRFGLRSYVYLGAHALIAKPAAWFVRNAVAADAAHETLAAVNSRVARVAPFYAVRLFLAVASALADAFLA